ncbi:MAG: polymer-forming cytoskeletal protein [Ignavibacteriaceae bacterium]
MKNNGVGKDEVTIISAGVVIEGKISSNGSVRIDGAVNGDVSANANITIGESGEINGEVNAEIITVGGRVVGTVIAREKLTLEAKSILKGDLNSKILVVEAGARFDGKSIMSGQVPGLKLETPAVSEQKQ